MASLLIGLVVIALIIVATLALEGASLSSASEISASWDQMTDRTGEKARTGLTLLTADMLGTGADIDISLRSTGQTPLADFSEWDVMIQYYATSSNQGMQVLRLSHTAEAAPPSGEWTVAGLYLVADTVAEVYEPNIFNPGEEMVIRLNITPAIPTTTDSMVTIGVTNGVTVAAPFTR